MREGNGQSIADTKKLASIIDQSDAVHSAGARSPCEAASVNIRFNLRWALRE
jgi:hypothetical protein